MAKETTNLSKEEYLKLVRQAKKKMSAGNRQDLGQAKKLLDKLENWRPFRLEYIAARVELMLLMGKDAKTCRNILDTVITERYFQPILGEIFRVKRKTFLEQSLGWRACDYTMHLYKGNDEKVRVYTECLQAAIDAVVEKNESITSDELESLAELYYITRDMTMYFVLMLAWCALNGKLDSYEEYLEESVGSMLPIFNLGYLAKQFQDGSQHVFVLVDDIVGVNKNLDILALALQILGQKVIVLRDTLEITEAVTDEQAVAVGMDTARTQGDIIFINPLRYQTEPGGTLKYNTEKLLLFIEKNIEQKGALIFFASDNRMEELLENRKTVKHIQRLTEFQPKQFAYNIAFGWAGKYTDYASFIYDFDVEDRINRSAECEISIVIPVRNNSLPLRYTLKTCLEQNFDGNYEIVLSDNSDTGNTEVYDLYREFDNPKIKYYHTPFVLNLAKSFEFAFLQSKGEFVFSLGADDGLFPWALKTIKELQGHMDDCEVMLWQRGFYAWPGFNYGQQNMLFVPFPRNRSPITHTKIRGIDWLTSTVKNIYAMLYRIPMLYINSGFKRSYFNTLLNRVGRLWDIGSQDVPMGTINMVINHHILYTDFPLSVAGMSEKSIGYQSSKSEVSFEEMASKFKSYTYKSYSLMIGEEGQGKAECHIPQLSIDYELFYATLFKLYELACVSVDDLKTIDWNDLFNRFVDRISPQDYTFELYMALLRYSASLCNNELNEWAKQKYEEKTIPTPALKITYSMKRVYQVGIDGEGNSICVDGADFGITNIEEAIVFLSKILNL